MFIKFKLLILCHEVEFTEFLLNVLMALITLIWRNNTKVRGRNSGFNNKQKQMQGILKILNLEVFNWFFLDLIITPVTYCQ